MKTTTFTLPDGCVIGTIAGTFANGTDARAACRILNEQGYTATEHEYSGGGITVFFEQA